MRGTGGGQQKGRGLCPGMGMAEDGREVAGMEAGVGEHRHGWRTGRAGEAWGRGPGLCPGFPSAIVGGPGFPALCSGRPLSQSEESWGVWRWEACISIYYVLVLLWFFWYVIMYRLVISMSVPLCMHYKYVSAKSCARVHKKTYFSRGRKNFFPGKNVEISCTRAHLLLRIYINGYVTIEKWRFMY